MCLLTDLLTTSRAGPSVHVYTHFFSLDSEQIDRCKRQWLHFASIATSEDQQKKRFLNETHQKDIL